MVAKKGNKPIYFVNKQSVQVAVFKNKNIKGSVYPLICIGITKYPLKFTRKIYLSSFQLETLKEVLSEMPKIELKEKKMKKTL